MTEFGKPFAVARFGNWFCEQCDMANLRHCTLHGLRKAASVRLAEAGCQSSFNNRQASTLTERVRL
jgi:hypothetical protein